MPKTGYVLVLPRVPELTLSLILRVDGRVLIQLLPVSFDDLA